MKQLLTKLCDGSGWPLHAENIARAGITAATEAADQVEASRIDAPFAIQNRLVDMCQQDFGEDQVAVRRLSRIPSTLWSINT